MLFLNREDVGTKRAALMIWENCDSNFDLLNIQDFVNCPNMTSGMTSYFLHNPDMLWVNMMKHEKMT